MVLTIPTYNPQMVVSDIRPGGIEHPAGKGLLQFNVRILSRSGEVILDFGQFDDLISWRDSLSVEGASGTFTLRMKASLCNQDLLRKVHPGLLVEAYCARNADSIAGVISDPSQIQRVESAPPTPLDGIPDATTPDPIAAAPTPVEDAYLDKAQHLLIRGLITDYGRSSEGGETSLFVTGESYGKIYKDSYVLTDLASPESLSVSLEVRNGTQMPLGAALIYYRLLRDWVENFWGQSTGWEARTRPIPFPPNYISRINNEGSVWSNLQFLAIEGFFHMFVDHTGAIVWEKLPYSSRDQSLIAGRCWEDLPILELPSWKIVSWSDRLSEQGITNYLRCVPTQQGISGGHEQAAQAALIYNMGSIRQYGGVTKRELFFPIGIQDKDNWYTSAPRRQQQATNNSFIDLCALEAVRWFDRPVQRVGVTCRGESAWRIHTRVSLKEDWHCPDAEPGEYYVVSRTHQIDIGTGSWVSQLELLRDRRKRYLGIGVGSSDKIGTVQPPTPTDAFLKAQNFSFAQTDIQPTSDFTFPSLEGEFGTTAIETEISADDYWWFDRFTGKVVQIGGDPIAWANNNVVPKLGATQAQPTTVTPPTAAPTPEAIAQAQPTTFEPVDRLYTDHLEDESPPGAYDFSLERNGNVITAIPSPVAGTITQVGQQGGYGNVVEVKGDDGYTYFLAHMDSQAVQVGDRVSRGQTLGNQGFTGHVIPPDENGAHIHMEISNDQQGAGNPANRITDRSITRPMVQEYLRYVQSGGK
jgi:biotin carboxyl carrier protein